MKKILLTAGIVLGSHLAFAQAPEKMSYQAIVRNTGGQVLANQSVGVRVSVLQGSPAGTVVYSERLTGSTNANGLLTMELGTGTVLSGTFNTINWPSGSYYLKTETDPTGGTNYTITGTSQLLSVPYAMFAKSAGGVSGGGTFSIPYVNTFTNAGSLFSITNNGDGTSLEGVNSTTTSSIASVRGMVTNTAPGGFSTGVRGINNGTGGLGVGVWGSQDGSGWGVYGSTPAGLGVYGNATAAGYGVYANSNSGTGLNATSINGIAASIAINNNSNNNNVLNVSSVGNGRILNVSTTGNGVGVFSSTGSGFAVQGITSAQTSAGIIGDNSGAGEAIVGRTTSGIAGAVVGRNDGAGYGVHGFLATDTSGNGIGVYGRVGVSNSTGRAGRFQNFNTANDKNTLESSTNSLGDPGTPGAGAGIYAESTNTNTVAPAIYAKTNTIFANFGSSGIYSESAGTGGTAGTFYSSNTTGGGNTLVAVNDGNGKAIIANANTGNAIEANVDGAGKAMYGWVPSFSTGQAADFQNFNTSNTKTVLTAKTVGNGAAGEFNVSNTNGTSPAVHGIINSQFANFGTAAIYGESTGTGGYAGLFHQSNASSATSAVIVLNDGTGDALTVNAGQNGNAVEAYSSGTGASIYGYTPNFGTGRAGYFRNFNTANSVATLTVTNAGTGTAFFVNHTGTSGNIASYQNNSANVARIDKTGKGFFNGGTQNSGADLAEAFDVEGNVSEYEPGDILIISTDSDRTVEKSSKPYSNLVAGVYATKPGVLLTEENVDSELIDKVPMGVVGVIPTKVCLEGGKIKRGDLLVTSSKSGVAMKANIKKVKIGQVIGKALQDYDQNEIGKIKVLVNIK